jgi:TPR repeat protein/serine/threonine protein kinase
MDTRFALPTNTVLDGAYRIVRVVGLGGFGITYEAEDIKLATTVAIKEYYPVDYGDRDRTMSVRPKSERHKKPFEWGRASFLKEARTLARFDHPSIVRVSRVFEANSTAYMVMGFERGQSFEAWLNGLGRPPTQDELDAIALPLLDALELMHAANFLHRDIAPDNIIVRADGSPVLLDFGAARRAVAEMSRALTGIVKAGYSPHEQYSSNNRLQGPWSDLYALGGTFYRAVTGGPPEEATLRVDDDRMAPAALAARSTYRAGFLAGIDACLRVKHTDRPQSVAELRPILLSQEARTRPALSFRTITSARSKPRQSEPRPVAPAIGMQWPLAAAAILVILGSAYGGIEFIRWQEEKAGIAGQPNGKSKDAQSAEAERRKEEAEAAAQRQVALDAERQRQEAARREEAERQRQEAARREEAERQRQEAARREEAERQRQQAEQRRKEEEQRRRDAAQIQGRILKLAVRLDKQADDPKAGSLGAGMEPLELSIARGIGLLTAEGAVIVHAPEGSAAARSGIRIGDVVLSLNSRPVASPEDLRKRVSTMAPGSEAALEVWRVDGDFLGAMGRLADAGNADAMQRVGRMHASGLGAPRDDAEAVRWFRKAAGAGSIAGEVALAGMLLDGRGVARDRAEGLRLLREAAAKKDSEAMYRLGLALMEGVVTDKDPIEAAQLFTEAAEAGHAGAMVAIGRMYATGTGVQADPSRAGRWFTRAVDLGDPGGMAGLAWLYEQGKGVEPDITKAVTLYKRAADLGNQAAMTDLALLYVQGRGVQKSEPAAVELYRKAAELGSSIAMNNLAWMLQSGMGVARKDPTEAARLMMKALERRNEFSLQQMTRPGARGFDGWSREFRTALQRALRDAGLYTGPTNGVFGETTIKAVEAQYNRNR